MPEDLNDRIIQILVRKGRASYAQIASEVGLSAHAVAERVRRLEARGTIQGYTARIDQRQLGRGVNAYIDVRLLPTTDPHAFEQLALGFPATQKLAFVTGRFDYIVELACRDTTDLDETVREIRYARSGAVAASPPPRPASSCGARTGASTPPDRRRAIGKSRRSFLGNLQWPASRVQHMIDLLMADHARLTEDATLFDGLRLRAERLERAQAGLRESGLAAALLFDPNNVRYAVSIGVAVVENLHTPSRWALVPAEGAPILWEYEDALHLAADRFGGEVRPAAGWTFFGSGSNSARDAAAFAIEVDDVLRGLGIRGERLGIDRLSAVAFLALQEEGIALADAQAVIEEARGIKTQDETILLRRNARVCDTAVEAMRARIAPGVTENELWARTWARR